MDGQETDGLSRDGWTDDKHMNGQQTDGRTTEGWTVERRMEGQQQSRWTDGRTQMEWMDGWTDNRRSDKRSGGRGSNPSQKCKFSRSFAGTQPNQNKFKALKTF